MSNPHHRRGYESYIAETLDYQESQQLDPVRLDLLVTQLRSGDRSVSNEIVMGHIRMVMGIVGERVRSRRKLDDVIGAALLALVEAVDDAVEALYDNNITYYITEKVKYGIKDALAADHVVRVSARTIRHKIAQGEKFEDIVPGDPITIAEDDPNADADMGDGVLRSKGHKLPYSIPIAKPFSPSIEFKEALNKAARGPMEQAIVKLRSEGFGYAEIGKKVGMHTSRVGQIMAPIEERFSALYDA